jgi:hypothetical protein
VPGGIPTQSVGTISVGTTPVALALAVDLALALAFDLDLDLPHRKAERRFCAVGTAARMPR